MPACPGCQAPMTYWEWANYCEVCGAELAPLTDYQPRQWDSSLPDAVLFNWLAQCERRLTHPVDALEATGLSAFEYAWKAFNALYSPFPGKTAHKQMIACVHDLLDAAVFVAERRSLLNSLCTYLLPDEGQYRIEFDDPTGTHPALVDRARENARQLRRALEQDHPGQAIELVLRILYALRNARIHGRRELASERVKRGGRIGPPALPIEFYADTMPELLLALCTSLLARTVAMPPVEVREIITSRCYELVDEIIATVGRWGTYRRNPFVLVKGADSHG